MSDSEAEGPGSTSPGGPWPARDQARVEWHEARAAARQIAKIAKRAGYLAAFMGSTVMDGVGADLDIILVPWRPSADWRECVAGLSEAFPNTARSEVYYGTMGTASILIAVYGGRWILDLQFREVEAPHPVMSKLLDLKGVGPIVAAHERRTGVDRRRVERIEVQPPPENGGPDGLP